MRKLFFIPIILLLGCQNKVEDTKIENIDFSNYQEVEKIAQRLDPDRRTLFQYYAASRTSIFPGKEVVRPDGKAPKTVEEAILLAGKRKKQIDDRNMLINERNKLVDFHNKLIDNGSSVAEIEDADLKIKEIDKKISGL
ncbi:hypothetical protein [Sphingomonas sp. VDB2]|uniref:hypothetical protein n=1 Tax=Sphingomonas sp. VDB2 TaxID=3228751 RepID=UPI003A7FDF0C